MKGYGFRETKKQFIMQHVFIGFEHGKNEWVLF
jgi:hypothetical protein